MKKLLLLGFLISSLIVNAQDFYSSGDCKAGFKFEVNPNIYTLLPATAINFYDASVGDVKEWYWDNGDTIISREKNPMIVFNHPMSGPTVKMSPYKKITLTIVTENCKSTFSQIINIVDGTLYEDVSTFAKFKYYESARDLVAGTVTFNFNNYSIGNNLSYDWKFEDGTVSSLKEPSVTLKITQKVFKVCLMVTGSNGSTDTMCDKIYIEEQHVTDTTKQECQVAFGYKKSDILVTNTASSTFNFYYKSYPEVKEWYWDFGDGTTSNDPNPTHTFSNPIPTDSDAGNSNVYRAVCLTVITVDGCKTFYCEKINISNITPPPPVPVQCQAHFKYAETSRDANAGVAVVIFGNGSTGEDLKYLWMFGDGTTSTDKEPVKKFSLKQSVYRVCLHVTGADSCTSSFCEAVYLTKPNIEPIKCEVQFKYEKKEVLNRAQPAMLVNFYSRANTEVKEYYWDFGDGTKSNEANPTHTYYLKYDSLSLPNPNVEVCLTVITVDGCKAFYCEKINISSITPLPPVTVNCQAHFKYAEISRDSVAGVAVVRFGNGSIGKDLKYLWKFSDGTTSTDKEPVKRFSLKESAYKVCLIITGADSCTSTFCDAVYLQKPIIEPVKCEAYFGYDKKDVLMGPLPSMLVNFYSKVNAEVKEYYWDFGDGSTSNIANPTHAYYLKYDSLSLPNPYRTVCLTVVTTDGCKVTKCDRVQVFDIRNPEPEKCKAYFKYYEPTDIISIPELVPIKFVDVSEGNVISRFWKFENGKTSTDKEPLMTFDIFKEKHQVCLTVTYADSCMATFCDYVYVGAPIVDPVVLPPVCPYTIKVDGGFPIQMSSCAGWASAKVYLDGKEVEPVSMNWSTGDTLQKIGGLCPTQTYTVKAQMADGCVAWTNFLLNSDGSISPVSPISWWLTGGRDRMYVQSNAGNDLQVSWRLCDGTIVEADSIPLDAINCGGSVSNMIIKDSLGNVVYSESIALKGSVTGLKEIQVEPKIKLWPNPVANKLNVRYSGEYQSNINIEIYDIMGKQVSTESFFNISDGYETSINTESLKEGIYICRISSEGKIFSSEKFSRK